MKQCVNLGWRNTLRYYVPLCPRPVVPVTTGMLSRVVVPTDTDNEAVKNSMSILHRQLAEYLGSEIIADSQHLYTGQIMRAVIYMAMIANVMPFDILTDLVWPLFLCFYGAYSCYVMDAASIHKRYKILIE